MLSILFEELFITIFSGVVVLNCSYYLYFSKFSFSRTPRFQNIKRHDAVSIIICAKNESQRLENLIQLISLQNLNLFEIIVVNDNSNDNSLEILQQLAIENSRLKVINLNAETGKKAGITRAINASLYSKILLTDADCIPISTDWAALMIQNLIDEKHIVLGYSGYIRYGQSLLNKIIRYETLLTATQYLGYAVHNNAYMGVGRNLAYTKGIFKSSNGFDKHAHIRAGDDDLFVNENATSTNISICVNPESFTYSEPKKKWKDWFIQKRRHTDVAKLYKQKHQIQLALFYITQFLFFALIPFVLFNQQFLTLVVVLILIRTVIFWVILSKAAAKLREADLIKYLPFLEPFLIILQMLIFISNIMVKPRRWN
ncbi:glycosyltransferase [Leeuwenhoekiella aequorea]|uniref:Cellulose synthase/poly-beta-1,6-N-acetylglucosamine synthase-like glycosyltransferase n=1 Tax=Leeuwenhoekiella aequorea TaxID=283736 RepID=A0A4Q0PD98_9FLAO|nr:glycosyltransferase [Leeuwenhoekiella aequorea]RXG24797.1 cellulose synthase/poly-beta-1,6-N-acetylglucosamine synthase-like glycosyltransferase [Leeuwenhoekiella aequorea]